MNMRHTPHLGLKKPETKNQKWHAQFKVRHRAMQFKEKTNGIILARACNDWSKPNELEIPLNTRVEATINFIVSSSSKKMIPAAIANTGTTSCDTEATEVLIWGRIQHHSA
jgi:hypothetical protein